MNTRKSSTRIPLALAILATVAALFLALYAGRILAEEIPPSATQPAVEPHPAALATWAAYQAAGIRTIYQDYPVAVLARPDWPAGQILVVSLSTDQQTLIAPSGQRLEAHE